MVRHRRYDSFRFKVGDRVKIVSKERCRELDGKYAHMFDHSFLGGEWVTIKSIPDLTLTDLQVYIIEEYEGYYKDGDFFHHFLEDEYFV